MRISILGSIVLASILSITNLSAQKAKKTAPAVAATETKVDINKVFKNWFRFERIINNYLNTNIRKQK